MSISEKTIWALIFLYIGLLLLALIEILANNKVSYLLIENNQKLIMEQLEITLENNKLDQQQIIILQKIISRENDK